MTNPSDGAPVRHSTGRDRGSTVATPGQGPAGPVPRGRALPSVLRRPRRVPSRKSARIAAVLVAVPGARPDIGPSSSLLRLLAAPVGLILCPERPVEPHGLGLRELCCLPPLGGIGGRFLSTGMGALGRLRRPQCLT